MTPYLIIFLFSIALTSGQQVCFFTKSDFTGDKLCANEGQRIDVFQDNYSLNDKFQSVIVPCGLHVHVYDDDGFHGWNMIYEGDVADFKAFSNVISSFEVIQRDKEICFFTGKDLTGEKFCAESGMDVDISVDHRDFNDDFESVKIPNGLAVIAYADDSFHGYSHFYDVSTSDMVGFNNIISSFKVIDYRVCFYKALNYGGDKCCIEAHQAVDIYRQHMSLNDGFQSVKVPSGLRVSAFQEDTFHGDMTWYDSDKQDLGDFKNKISSIIVENNDKACFYSQKNYTGTKLCRGPGEFVTDLHSDNLNDVFKSVQLPHSLFTEVYTDVSFAGSSLYLLEDTPDLSTFDSKISSFVVGIQGISCFFASTTWSGNRTCAAYGDRINIGSNNDQFESLLMPVDLNVTAYRDTDFSGPHQSYTSPVKDLGSFKNVISSFIVNSTTDHYNAFAQSAKQLLQTLPKTSTLCTAMNDQGTWSIITDDQCRSQTKPFACSHTANANLWKVTTGSGAPSDGDRLCHVEFGDSYFYTVPKSSQSNAVLSRLISTSVWLNQIYDPYYNVFTLRQRRSTTSCGGVNQIACREELGYFNFLFCMFGWCPEAKCDVGLVKHELPSITAQFLPDFICRCPPHYRVKRALEDNTLGACRFPVSLTEDPPTIDQIRQNADVQRVLCEAWQLSVPPDVDQRGRQPRGTFQERGGWIYADPSNPSRMQAILAPLSRSTPFRLSASITPVIDLNSPRRGNPREGYMLVANFHTHPGLAVSGLNQGPSRADQINSYLRGVPGIVIAHDGLYTYGPTREYMRVPLTGDPRDYPEPGLEYSGQEARRAGDNTWRMPDRHLELK
jgi:hypothetical protein